MNEVAIKLSTVNSISLRLVQITNQNSYRNVTACVQGPFKCYVTQLGVGGCQVFRKIALRRCNIQRY